MEILRRPCMQRTRMDTLTRVDFMLFSSCFLFSSLYLFFFCFFFFRESPEGRQNIKASLSRESGHELLFRNVPYYNGPPRGEYRASRGEPLEDVFENVGARFSLGA